MAKTLEEIDESIRHLVAKRKQIAASQGSEIIFEWFKPIFEAFPNTIKNVWWTQYTPFFNDGEPCEFSVHDALLNYDDGNEEWDSSSPWHMQFIFNASFGNKPAWYTDEQWETALAGYAVKKAEYEAQGWTLESVNELDEVFKQASFMLQKHEDFVEESFGDHVLIILYPDGTVQVNDHSDHD
jgi:hypothetical protein